MYLVTLCHILLRVKLLFVLHGEQLEPLLVRLMKNKPLLLAHYTKTIGVLASSAISKNTSSLPTEEIASFCFQLTVCLPTLAVRLFVNCRSFSSNNTCNSLYPELSKNQLCRALASPTLVKLFHRLIQLYNNLYECSVNTQMHLAQVCPS